MSAFSAGWATSLAAFSAGLSWLVCYRRASVPFVRQIALLLTLWAGWEGWSGLLQLQVHPAAGWNLVVTATGLVLSGLCMGSLTRAIVVTGHWVQRLADAGLTAVCIVAVFWGTVGADHSANADVLSSLQLMSALTVTALLLQSPQTRGTPVADQRFQRRLSAATVVAGAFSVAAATSSLAEAGGRLPAVVPASTTTIAFLLLAASPWVPEAGVPAVGRSTRAPRGVPYGMILMATPALLFMAVRHGIGPVVPLAITVGVICLAVSQGVALRENARLSSALEYHQARMSALVDNSGDVILGLDPHGRMVTVNPAAIQLLARSPSALIGQPVDHLASAVERESVRAEVDDVVSGRQESARVELTLDAPATGTVELRLRAVPGGAVANLSDVTDAVRLRERLARLARQDQLTGLANRWALESELAVWLVDGRRVAVLFIDLDGFKGLNDRFGHLAGDLVLTTVAERLSSVPGRGHGTRPLVARFGGDEFVLALSDAGVVEAVAVAQQVVDALRPTFPIADRMVQIRGSVGISATDDGSAAVAGPSFVAADERAEGASGGAAQASDVLHRADVAMFAAKQAGAGHLQVWTPQVEERAVRRVDIAIGLRGALDTGRLALAYQPIVRLSDGEIIGAEALIRLAPADAAASAPGALAGLAELVTPAELVEVAEDTGAIDELGRWVLSEATHQAALWRAMSRDVHVNVNMSVRQLSDASFVETVHAALMAARLPADRLTVEITEGQLLTLGSPAELTARRLRDLGVLLVIDDFGSGYSSLGYLTRLPITGVKIDKSLLDRVDVDRRARLVLRAVVGLVTGLGLSVVCEGIENPAMARLVRDLGAHSGQGFAFYGPLAADEMRLVLDDDRTPSAGQRATGRTIDLTSRDARSVRLTRPPNR
jgi:diguanylate cyclase (GGDEF)-like protein/PAS domain S-box-containing protein